MTRPHAPQAQPWRVALAGMLGLAIAMGIGRFAFTPLLPMMLADGVVDLPGASWLASANYLGYLAGALLCMVQPWLWVRLGRTRPVDGVRWIRRGLVATVLLTLGMALQIETAWPLLRFSAGLASALVFVHTSLWCLARLARLGVPAMGALIYVGPGAGIVLSGLFASGMVALHWPAAAGWLIFGVLAALLTAAAWPLLAPSDGAGSEEPAPGPAAVQTLDAGGAAGAAPDQGAAEIGLLALAYGLAGFGYIITATFLPVIARQALPASPWLDMFWPIFGIGVMAGALIASRTRTAGVDLRLLLAGCYAVQALGIGVGLWRPSLAGFALGSLLLGLPFTAITFFAMQEARRLKPARATGLVGLLTALYGLGQIVGPPLAAALLARSATPQQGFTLSLEIAAAALTAGAGLYLLLAWLYPPARVTVSQPEPPPDLSPPRPAPPHTP